jgi:transposase
VAGVEAGGDRHQDDHPRTRAHQQRPSRLRQIPGLGPLVSTATVAAIGNGAAFRRGRDFAAWVGVVPRQYSTGGKQKLKDLLTLWKDADPDILILK